MSAVLVCPCPSFGVYAVYWGHRMFRWRSLLKLLRIMRKARWSHRSTPLKHMLPVRALYKYKPSVTNNNCLCETLTCFPLEIDLNLSRRIRFSCLISPCLSTSIPLVRNHCSSTYQALWIHCSYVCICLTVSSFVNIPCLRCLLS